jgi:putative ABC transport system permease protein
MRLQQRNVLRELNRDLSLTSSNMFLMNIQKDQRQAAEAAITRMTSTAPQLIPMVLVRLVGINRVPNNPQTLPAGMFGYEQGVTYRSELMPDETVIDGKFWEPRPSAEPEVAVRDNFARDYKLVIGDVLIFDITGRRIEAKVTAVRRINWGFSIGQGYARFNIYFRPGSLDDAPQTFFGTAKGPPPGDGRARLQQELIDQFPNVSVIDFYDQAEFMRSKLNDFSLAVNFLGGFVFLCGVLILTGSVAMTKFHRLYEAAILKTLGAKKKLIVYITVIEYGVLGLLAGLVGSSSATVLTWAISKYGMKVPWRFVPSINIVSVVVTLLLVMVVGVLSSWDVLRKKPLSILRAE